MKLILKRVVYFRESGACLKIAVSEEMLSDLRIHSEEALSKNCVCFYKFSQCA